MLLLFSPILPSLCGVLQFFFSIIRCSLFSLLLRSLGIHGILFQRGHNWLNLLASSKIMCLVSHSAKMMLPAVSFSFASYELACLLSYPFFLFFLSFSFSFFPSFSSLPSFPSLHPSFPPSGLPSWLHSVFIFLFNKWGVPFTLSTQVTLCSCCCSASQSRATLCDPTDCCTPGLPVRHQFPELAQTHIRWLSDAIQPSHPLSSPSPPTLNLSQHQGLFIPLGAIGLPRWVRHEESACQCRRPKFHPWVGEIPLEKEMVTHSSFLAWEIPWSEEPGGLWSMGSQRVRHDWSNLENTH